MTPTELKWFGNVAAEASARQQGYGFIQEIALEMLDGKSPEEAQAVASQKLWEDVLNWEITSKASQFMFSPDGNPNLRNQMTAGDELICQQDAETDLTVINEQTGATQQTVETTQKSPTYEELVQKEDRATSFLRAQEMKKAGYLSAAFARGYPAGNSIKLRDRQGGPASNRGYGGSSQRSPVLTGICIYGRRKNVFTNCNGFTRFLGPKICE